MVERNLLLGSSKMIFTLGLETSRMIGKSMFWVGDLFVAGATQIISLIEKEPSQNDHESSLTKDSDELKFNHNQDMHLRKLMSRYTHTIHVWYVYLHLVDVYGKCR